MISNKENKDIIEINFQKNNSIKIELEPEHITYKDKHIELELKEEEKDDCLVGEISLKIHNQYYENNYNLSKEKPVRILLSSIKQPEKITAFYLFLPWWTRPAFINSFSDIPEKTQIALFKYKDSYACFIPMVGDTFKTYLNAGTDDHITLEMTAELEGFTEIKEPLFIFAEAPTVSEAVQKAFSYLAKDKGISLRENREYPEILNYLGWCSWNAFYQNVSEDNIIRKVEELNEKELPVKWMIIDDGWLSTKDEKLTHFEPDKEKFPNGFSEMIKKIKRESSFNWIGLWHTLFGAWEGIEPESNLAIKERENLYQTTNGRITPNPETGDKFFINWYDYLKRDGIDFVKVDSQSSVPFFLENNLAIPKAAQKLNQNLEEASYLMNNTVVNCMGMAMENILSRKSSGISRNSDDFFPNRKDSFKEHLLQNAYNSIYHNQIYHLDWDMFWTSHLDNKKHALIRAISGGPIYFSDELGKTEKEVIKPLIYSDGRIIKMDRSASPTEDCIFIDPFKEGILKLQNTASWGSKLKGGIIAAFNLTDKEQKLSFKPDEIEGISKAQDYWVFNYFSRKSYYLKKAQSYLTIIGKDEYGYYLVLPKVFPVTCLGLINKYVGFTAIESIIESEKSQTIILKETGLVGILSQLDLKNVYLNNNEVEFKEENKNFYLVDLPEKNEKAILSINW